MVFWLLMMEWSEMKWLKWEGMKRIFFEAALDGGYPKYRKTIALDPFGICIAKGIFMLPIKKAESTREETKRNTAKH